MLPHKAVILYTSYKLLSCAVCNCACYFKKCIGQMFQVIRTLEEACIKNSSAKWLVICSLVEKFIVGFQILNSSVKYWSVKWKSSGLNSFLKSLPINISYSIYSTHAVHIPAIWWAVWVQEILGKLLNYWQDPAGFFAMSPPVSLVA